MPQRVAATSTSAQQEGVHAERFLFFVQKSLFLKWISASCSLQRVVWENSIIGKIEALPSNFTMCIFQKKVAIIQKLCSLNIEATGVGAGLPDSCAIHIGLKTNEPSFRSETLASRGAGLPDSCAIHIGLKTNEPSFRSETLVPRLLTVLSLLAIQTTVLLLEFVNPHVKDSSGEVT
ncbi:hypothetical protein L3X38_001545 [Prunus dulcis]|uniref:Uncharacterized protein n=1 Tax=Prunus dulcis TaxID=3755 RepID=A0AAD4WSR3_PRUDU|nr:hypothetical protein L3X38_001545 [Prunus dulcis]